MATIENCKECRWHIRNIGNQHPFCEIGYTQNPKTPLAMKNVLANKGNLCPTLRAILGAQEKRT